MKTKRFIIILCALLTIAMIGTAAALAASGDTTEEVPDTTLPDTASEWRQPRTFHFSGDLSELPEGFRSFPELTDEQKAELEKRLAEMEERIRGFGTNKFSEKLDGLTDEQKAELEGLQDQMADIQSQIIDKYLEWGLIDEETANRMKEGKTTMVPGGDVFEFHFDGGEGFRGFEFKQKDQQSSDDSAQGTGIQT